MRLGIDFGTCFSSAAFMKDGGPTPVKFGHNETSLPSSACVDGQGRVRVGRVAENLRRGSPARYRREFKLDLGTRTPYRMGDLSLLPEELVAELLREFKREAEPLGRNGGNFAATITVPANYSKLKRQLMEEAGRAAGFFEVALLEEPVAAAVYHAARRGAGRDGEVTLVYDLGGGTFDAALIRKEGAGYVALAAPVGTRGGGADFDRMIGNRLLEQGDESLRAALAADDLNAMRGRLIFADECRELKHRLGEEEVVEEELLLLPQAPALSARLTREDFNAMISPLLEETWDLCRLMVEGAGLDLGHVDRVLLVGGSSRIPHVREVARRELGRPVVPADDPELAVALGAALHTGGRRGRLAPDRGRSLSAAREAGSRAYREESRRGAATAATADANANANADAGADAEVGAEVGVEVEEESPALPARFVNSVGMEFVLIPPGAFVIGSDHNGYEAPTHRVTIHVPFYLGRFQVTQEQWVRVMGDNPSRFRGDALPVESVSWLSAQEFVDRLNALGDGYEYRLPSEAEWEYACRAGTTGDISGDPAAVAWYQGNSGGRTHPVGTRQPNAFGLYDMHGNVWEWCGDGWHQDYVGAPADGSGRAHGLFDSAHVARGGSWDSRRTDIRAARRSRCEREYDVLGLRVAASARA